MAGVVVKTGSSVTSCSVGDRVAGNIVNMLAHATVLTTTSFTGVIG